MLKSGQTAVFLTPKAKAITANREVVEYAVIISVQVFLIAFRSLMLDDARSRIVRIQIV